MDDNIRATSKLDNSEVLVEIVNKSDEWQIHITLTVSSGNTVICKSKIYILQSYLVTRSEWNSLLLRDTVIDLGDMGDYLTKITRKDDTVLFSSDGCMFLRSRSIRGPELSSTELKCDLIIPPLTTVIQLAEEKGLINDDV